MLEPFVGGTHLRQAALQVTASVGISKICRGGLCFLQNPKRTKRCWACIKIVDAKRSITGFFFFCLIVFNVYLFLTVSRTGLPSVYYIIFRNLSKVAGLPHMWGNSPSFTCELLCEYLDVLNECVK